MDGHPPSDDPKSRLNVFESRVSANTNENEVICIIGFLFRSCRKTHLQNAFTHSMKLWKVYGIRFKVLIDDSHHVPQFGIFCTNFDFRAEFLCSAAGLIII